MARAPDEAWIRSVILPILSALELLHREGVYHRDVAPDNILLSREGPPVLLDFGAARRVISDRTQSLTAILKPSYAPIEQYAETAPLRQGPWTDLYALGAVVHYLVFGMPPAPATARAVQDDGDAIERREVPGISPRFLETMSWMLAIRPNQRPQRGEQLRAVLAGTAQIPPRHASGTTVPDGGAGDKVVAAARAMAASAVPTRVDTAFAPTQLPTASGEAPANGRVAIFGPTASMPTARSGPAASPSPPPTLPQPSARAALDVPGMPASRPRSSRAWLAVAGGGAVVVIAAAVAWQLSPRREAAPAIAASTPASAAVAATVATSMPRPAPAMIVETAEEARSTAIVPPLRGEGQPVPRVSSPPFEATRPPVRERVGANADGAAANAARARAAARPVPRTGEDALSAPSAATPQANASPPLGAGNIGAIPYGSGNTGAIQYGTPNGAAPPIDRSPRPAPAARELPRRAAPLTDGVPHSAREACDKRAFIALAVCMDRVCEESRFRSTAECVGILARKAAREIR